MVDVRSAVFTAVIPVLAVSALDNGLGRTPPMGFNPWNCFGMDRFGGCKLVNPHLPPPGCHPFNETTVLDIAAALVSSGLRDVGYAYVNLDCGWTTGFRNLSTGRLIVNEQKFPHGMRWLGDRLHAMGLKFGIYASASRTQCCSKNNSAFANDGSYQHEKTDAEDFASWGVDYLKYDDCDPFRESYRAMRDALNATGRPILYSVHGPVGAEAVGLANAWRTTPDIDNTWDSMWERALANDRYAEFAGPGGWNMPDMLEVGNFFGPDLGNAESRTMMSIWAVMKAPLLIGTDITLARGPEDSAMEILGNPEVISVNQDPLGEQARLLPASASTDGRAWMGRLSGGAFVVAIVNDNNTSSLQITVDVTSHTGASAYQVRDLWRRADVDGAVSGSLTVTVGPHDTSLLKLERSSHALLV